MGILNSKNFQIQDRLMKIETKGYKNTYSCNLVKSVPINSKCNHPMFHLSMWMLIGTFFYLAATTKYKSVETYRTIASISFNV